MKVYVIQRHPAVEKKNEATHAMHSWQNAKMWHRCVQPIRRWDVFISLIIRRLLNKW